MCRKCKLNEETQRHLLLLCPKLSDNSVTNTCQLEYEDLLGNESNRIEVIGRILFKRFNDLKLNTDITLLCTDNISCAAPMDVGELE